MTGLTLGGAGVVAGAAVEVVTAGAAAGVLLGAVAVAQLGLSLRRMLGD
jgi:CDP-diacylglycerol--glycerol-3-phosphate 3-phosphatidyltransferase